MWPIDRPSQWVDRSQELATLQDGVEALRRGVGTAVWVEGEPGIGKSSLVVEALSGATEPGWDIGWGIADQLAERLPAGTSGEPTAGFALTGSGAASAAPVGHGRPPAGPRSPRPRSRSRP